MNYIEFLDYRRNAINNFPKFFAFSQEQFENGLKKLGVTEDEVIGIDGGGFIRRKDENDFINMIDQINKKFKELVLSDKEGNNFIFKMFCYELYIHEYGYTNDLTETLNALGLTFEEVEKNSALKNGLEKALDKYQNK